MAGLLEQDGGQEPPERSDLRHAVSSGKTSGCPASISTVDVQAGHLKAGAKECPKRKKASKMAKLKQSKLDARREQWLAQVSGRKSPPSRASSNGDLCHPVEEEHSKSSAFLGGGSEANPPGLPKPGENGHAALEGGERPALRRWQTQPPLRNEAGSAEETQPGGEATSSKVSKPNKGKKKKGARQKEAGGFEVIGEINGEVSGRVSGGVNEDVEDWEVAAEALGVVVPESGSEAGALSENGSHSQLGGDESGVSTVSEEASPVGRVNYLSRRLAPEAPDANGHHGCQQYHRSGGAAWRQDDSQRPETLPRLEKFNSFPMVPHHHTGSMWEATISRTIWGSPTAAPTCPICTEELDLTDTSFVPCPCGFRLCLFCHHRIAADDGRCPGCRKAYQSEVKVEKYIQVPRSHLVRLKV